MGARKGLSFRDEEARFLREIEERVGASKRRPDTLVALADQLLCSGFVDKAEDICLEVLATEPGDSRALRVAASIYRQRGRVLAAEVLERKAGKVGRGAP